MTAPYIPDYENNINSNMIGYNVIFEFPNAPPGLYKGVTFTAYIKAVTDTITPVFSPKEIYGRMDPIPIYNRTTRAIAFDLDIPSNGLSHSRLIATKLDILAI